MMTIALLSMAGIPPLAGFLGKYFLFTDAMKANPVLIVIAVINSAISVAYYLKPVTAMYFSEKEAIDNVVHVPAMFKVSLVATLVAMVLMIIFPDTVRLLAH